MDKNKPEVTQVTVDAFKALIHFMQDFHELLKALATKQNDSDESNPSSSKCPSDD
jgi:hypothetical protein